MKFHVLGCGARESPIESIGVRTPAAAGISSGLLRRRFCNSLSLEMHGVGANSRVVLVPQSSNDPNDPLNWSGIKKITILSIIALGIILCAATNSVLLNAGLVKSRKSLGSQFPRLRGSLVICFSWGEHRARLCVPWLGSAPNGPASSFLLCSHWLSPSLGLLQATTTFSSPRNPSRASQ
jgi:hypothetical protein